MNEVSLDESVNSMESKKKFESLFSKKFMDYLKSKKIDLNNTDPTSEKKLSKDISTSSDETTISDSSRKSSKKLKKKLKKKKSSWNINYSIRNKLTQCNLLKSEEEMVPPEELKPLLVNMTILLQDVKQSFTGLENLYNLISKITVMVTEFIRRPLKKISEDAKGEHFTNAEKILDNILTLLEEYKNGPNLDPDNNIREYKKLEKELANKLQEISEMRQNLNSEEQKNASKSKDRIEQVKSSILANENLKYEIKFNHGYIKKYKKAIAEKEWTKHKLETELSNLKKKLSKTDDLQNGESSDKLLFPSEIKSEKTFITTLQKHIKTKIKKEPAKMKI